MEGKKPPENIQYRHEIKIYLSAMEKFLWWGLQTESGNSICNFNSNRELKNSGFFSKEKYVLFSWTCLRNWITLLPLQGKETYW